MTYEEHINSLVGTTVKTRDGQDAKIVDVDFSALRGEIIIARVKSCARFFHATGKYLSWDDSALDLILPPMPRERKVHKVWIHEDGEVSFGGLFVNHGWAHDIEITVEKNPDTGKWEQVNP